MIRACTFFYFCKWVFNYMDTIISIKNNTSDKMLIKFALMIKFTINDLSKPVSSTMVLIVIKTHTNLQIKMFITCQHSNLYVSFKLSFCLFKMFKWMSFSSEEAQIFIRNSERWPEENISNVHGHIRPYFIKTYQVHNAWSKPEEDNWSVNYVYSRSLIPLSVVENPEFKF